MSHYYEIEGKKLPSVTQIIGDCTNKGDALTQWGANMSVLWIRQNCKMLPSNNIPWWEVSADDLDNARFNFKSISQTALDVGSMVHKAVEDYLKGKPVIFTEETPDQIQEAFAAFRKWENEHNLKPIALEQTVYGNGWAGTLDFLGYYDDKLYVIDWKSSKAHYKEMDYQVAAYRNACRKQENERIEGCGVLRLDKETGLPEWKDTSKTYLDDLAVFNAMVNLYMLRHPKIRKVAQWKSS